MSKDDRDEMIRAQQEVIGILFEVVKRLQENGTLDQEYLEMLCSEDHDQARMQRILDERNENARIVGRLLERLDD